MLQKLPSLERLVSNLRTNQAENIPEDIEANVDLLTRTYRAYNLAINSGLSMGEISRTYRLSVSNVHNWRVRSLVPRIIRKNLTSYIGNTVKARRAFATILGTYARSTSGERKSKTELSRRPANEISAQRLQKQVGIVLNQKTTIDGPFKIRDRKLLDTLGQAFSPEEYQKWTSTDDERKAFLQGHFDVSIGGLYQSGRSLSYRIQTIHPLTREMITRALFELGVYTSESSPTGLFHVSGHKDLRKLIDLEILVDQDQINRIQQQQQEIKTTPGDPSTYYGIRRVVSQTPKAEIDATIKQLSEETDIPVGNIRYWCGDLLGRKRTVVPKAAVRNDRICETLGLPNVYAATKPTQRNEKWFFPMGWKTYELPVETQSSLLDLLGEEELTEQHTQMVWDLLRNPTVKNYLNLKVIEDKIVEINLSNDFYEPVKIAVNGNQYVLSSTAIIQYFLTNGITPDSLATDDIEYIQQELEFYLKKSSSDLKFTIEGENITKIGLTPTPFGARKSSRSSEGKGEDFWMSGGRIQGGSVIINL